MADRGVESPPESKGSMPEPQGPGSRRGSHPDREGSMLEPQGPSIWRGSDPDRKGSVAPPKALDLDDVLVNELGQFGRFQLYNILLVAFPMMISAFVSEYIFSAAAIPHRCQVPECGESTKDHPYDPEWVLNAIPLASSGGGFSSCERYAPTSSGVNGSLDYCPAYLFSANTVECEGLTE